MKKQVFAGCIMLLAALSAQATPTVTYQGPIEPIPSVTSQGFTSLCKEQHIIVRNEKNKSPALYNEYICYGDDNNGEPMKNGFTSDGLGICLQKVITNQGVILQTDGDGEITKIDSYALPIRSGCDVAMF